MEALFLCGASAVGKTTAKERILKDTKFKKKYISLNLDDIEGSREEARKTFINLVNETIESGKHFLYDGTCRDKHNMLDRLKKCKEKGYKTKMVILYASKETILKRIKNRHEQPISEEGAIDIYDHVSKNIEVYFKSAFVDEVFLYENETEPILLYHRKGDKIQSLISNRPFYFQYS